MRFVTAFIDLKEDRSKDKSYEKYVALFDKLATTGIKIHFFVSKGFLPLFEKYGAYKNIVLEEIELEDLEISKMISANSSLPAERTEYHDTRNFLTLMNAKIEFIWRSMARFPKEQQFAWIDSGIFHVFREPEKTSKWLQVLAESSLCQPCLLFPGSWGQGWQGEKLFAAINWRFLGGFFIGDRKSLEQMWRQYEEHFGRVCQIYGLTWEVNFWAWLEANQGWRPTWFKADHNDSIVKIPSNYFKVVASLTSIPSRFNHSLRPCLDSLLTQVDHIYLAIPAHYPRFPQFDELIPYFLTQEPYRSKVTITRPPMDYGPATKVVGTMPYVPKGSWVFVCDDDQEYHSNLIEKMKMSIEEMAIYQNHFRPIQQKTSGGLIHGYVGYLIHSSFLPRFLAWPLPDCAKFVDDQWMSAVCYREGLRINGTRVEEYRDIFKTLDGWHEKIGIDSLAGLQNRDQKVKEIEEYFSIRFGPRGIVLEGDSLSSH